MWNDDAMLILGHCRSFAVEIMTCSGLELPLVESIWCFSNRYFAPVEIKFAKIIIEIKSAT
jgi:hypothetical protein